MHVSSRFSFFNMFTCCLFRSMQEKRAFSFTHAEHYQVYKKTTKRKGAGEGNISFKSGRTQVSDQPQPRQGRYTLVLACSVVMMIAFFVPMWAGVLGVCFFSYLCRPCCCVSAWEMTLVMPAHPSLPPSLRKPDSSPHKTPTEPSTHPPPHLPLPPAPPSLNARHLFFFFLLTP